MNTSLTNRLKLLALAAIASAAAVVPASASAQPFLNAFSTISTVASAVPTAGPAMGDQNPYGLAVVPRSKGDLVRGDVLISNFNNSQNFQGTGSSIVEVSPSGNAHVFAVVPQPTSTAAVGLTTALVALRSGYVIVGSLPAPGGASSAMTAGALSVLNPQGQVVETLSGGDINGPWDMTAVEKRHHHVVLFVTNVLNGTVANSPNAVNDGTVVRITLSIRHHRIPRVASETVIANGFAERTDPNALVVGPTGVGLGHDGTLYVADSNANRIAAVPDALHRMTPIGNGGVTVSTNPALNDPLGLTIAPNGHILTVNGADGNAIETAPRGHQVAVKELIANGGGDLFGLAVAPHGDGLYFVNDNGNPPGPTNSLMLLH